MRQRTARAGINAEASGKYSINCNSSRATAFCALSIRKLCYIWQLNGKHFSDPRTTSTNTKRIIEQKRLPVAMLGVARQPSLRPTNPLQSNRQAADIRMGSSVIRIFISTFCLASVRQFIMCTQTKRNKIGLLFRWYGEEFGSYYSIVLCKFHCVKASPSDRLASFWRSRAHHRNEAIMPFASCQAKHFYFLSIFCRSTTQYCALSALAELMASA